MPHRHRASGQGALPDLLDQAAILFLLQGSLSVADLLPQVASFGQDAIGGPSHMLPCSGPPILLCLLNHTRSDGILLHISHGRIGMHLIQDRGIEPPLPEMTGGSSPTVDILGIPPVKQIEGAEPFEILQGIGRSR